jgi:hypothetical protein
MSFQMFKIINELNCFTPLQKLVLYELAAFQNDVTGVCNPSPERIALSCKMTAPQVRRVQEQLIKTKIIERSHKGWQFNLKLPDKTFVSIPLDWFPSSEALQILTETYPHHHFDSEEAAHDFIKFVNGREISIEPNARDASFITNISAILERRPTGNVKIGYQKNDQRQSLFSTLFN